MITGQSSNHLTHQVSMNASQKVKFLSCNGCDDNTFNTKKINSRKVIIFVWNCIMTPIIKCGHWQKHTERLQCTNNSCTEHHSLSMYLIQRPCKGKKTAKCTNRSLELQYNHSWSLVRFRAICHWVHSVLWFHTFWQ